MAFQSGIPQSWGSLPAHPRDRSLQAGTSKAGNSNRPTAGLQDQSRPGHAEELTRTHSSGNAPMAHRCCSAGPGNRKNGPWMSFPQQRWPIVVVRAPGRTASVAHRCGSPRGYAWFAVAAGQHGAARSTREPAVGARAGDLPVLRHGREVLSRWYLAGLDPEHQPALSLLVVTITKCEPEPAFAVSAASVGHGCCTRSSANDHDGSAMLRTAARCRTRCPGSCRRPLIAFLRAGG